MRWYKENQPGLNIDKTVKVAIAGKLISGEFKTVARNDRTDTVLQGLADPDTGEIVKSRVIRAWKVDPALATQLAGGQVLVFN